MGENLEAEKLNLTAVMWKCLLLMAQMKRKTCSMIMYQVLQDKRKAFV